MALPGDYEPGNFAERGRAALVPAMLFEGGLGLLAIALGWLFGYPPLATLRLDAAGFLWGLVATGPMLVLLLFCVRSHWRPLEEIRRIVEQLLVPLFIRASLLEIALLSLLAGLGEELMFRGFLQPLLADLWPEPAGTWFGLAAASLLFGLAHPVTRMYVVLAALMGAYLGGLWLAARNLLAPVVAHALYDFVAILWMVRAAQAGHLTGAAAKEPRERDEAPT